VRRTTRQSLATEAGLAFYRRVKPAFAEISEARLEAANRRVEPSGLLRIASPVVFGATYVVPAIAEFFARYPQIETDLKLSDRPVDVVGDGFDLAVRIRELPDSSLRARRLGELRTVVYGAPSYFARHGRQITLKILQVINALCAAPVMGRQKHGGFGLTVASKKWA
jgi:DNA-binding transcriptional LysR family regulator